MANPLPTPRFSRAEVYEYLDEANSTLLNQYGSLDDPGHWCGNQADLSRALLGAMDEIERLRDRNLHG